MEQKLEEQCFDYLLELLHREGIDCHERASYSSDYVLISGKKPFHPFGIGRTKYFREREILFNLYRINDPKTDPLIRRLVLEAREKFPFLLSLYDAFTPVERELPYTSSRPHKEVSELNLHRLQPNETVGLTVSTHYSYYITSDLEKQTYNLWLGSPYECFSAPWRETDIICFGFWDEKSPEGNIKISQRVRMPYFSYRNKHGEHCLQRPGMGIDQSSDWNDIIVRIGLQRQ